MCILVTSSNKKLPVMIFIHGGGYLMGSPNGYGPDFLISYDVILVSNETLKYIVK